MNSFDMSTLNDENDFEFTDNLFKSAVEEKFLGSSRLKRGAIIECNRAAGDAQLHLNYFCDYPTYTKNLFERRFRVCGPILEKVCAK